MYLQSTLVYVFLIFTFDVYFQSGNTLDFKSEQLKYSRVRKAYHDNEESVLAMLREKSIDPESLKIFLRIFKQEELIELWARDNEIKNYVHLKNYRFCSTSGKLGPKRKQGDSQIPEGFYIIDRFNPYSNFYLSLGINYPNKSDRILGDDQNPGGDIFIHGNCVTIGCIPITDEWIKELYIIAVEAKNHGQAEIPVHIFPDRLDDENFEKLCHTYQGDPEIIRFWTNLKEGYDHFEINNSIPGTEIDTKGKYIFY